MDNEPNQNLSNNQPVNYPGVSPDLPGSNSSDTPLSPLAPRKRSLLFPLTILFILVIGGLAYYFLVYTKNVSTKKGWILYKNTDLHFSIQYPEEYQPDIVKDRISFLSQTGDTLKDKIKSIVRVIPSANELSDTNKKEISFEKTVSEWKKSFKNPIEKNITVNNTKGTELAITNSCSPSVNGLAIGQAINQKSKCAEYYSFFPYNGKTFLIRTIVFSYKDINRYYQSHEQMVESFRPL